MGTTQITEIHSLAKMFPDMGDSEFEDLKEDIKKRGLLESIWTYEGKVLDGRHRFSACNDLGMECSFRKYEGNDPVGFVISLNLKRRHLDTSQKAMVGTRIATLNNAGRPKLISENSLITQAEAAKTVNVSIDVIKFAKKVIDKGAPELIESVQSGKVKVSLASDIAELPNSEQVEIVSMNERAVPIELMKNFIKKADELLPLTTEIEMWSKKIFAKLTLELGPKKTEKLSEWVTEINVLAERKIGELEKSHDKAGRGKTKSTWLKLSEDITKEYDNLKVGLYKLSISGSYNDIRNLVDINKLIARAKKIVNMLKDATIKTVTS